MVFEPHVLIALGPITAAAEETEIRLTNVPLQMATKRRFYSTTTTKNDGNNAVTTDSNSSFLCYLQQKAAATAAQTESYDTNDGNDSITAAEMETEIRLQQQINRLAQMTPEQTTVNEMSRLASRSVLAAQFLHTNLPIQLAQRLQEMQRLPYIVLTNPYINRVYQLNIKAFKLLTHLPQVCSCMYIYMYDIYIYIYVYLI